MKFRRTPALVVAALSAWSGTESARAGSLTLDNGLVKVSVSRETGGYGESWYGRTRGGWRLVARSGSETRPGQVLGMATGEVPVTFLSARSSREGRHHAIELRGVAGTDTITKQIWLLPGSRFAEQRVTLGPGAVRELSSLLSTYAFVPGGREYGTYAPLDFVFTPQLTPRDGQVIADHVFRAPAFVMQKGSVAAAIVPDLPSLDGKNRPLRAGAELRATGRIAPWMSFGLMNWEREKEHVYYVHADSMVSRVGAGTLGYRFQFFITCVADDRRAYQEIVREQWSRYGAAGFQNPVNPQDQPFASYIHKAWYEFVPQVAMDATYRGVPVTLLRQGRLAWSNKLPPAADNDAWFNVWFNSLRTAYGMRLHAVDQGDTALARLAGQVLNLALLAPQSGGLAPSIFYVDSTGGHWVADQAWGGIEDGRFLSMFHNAWTSVWMLAWIDLAPERKDEILAFTRRVGDALLGHQRPGGVIPSWYDPETGTPSPILRDENAETAGAALLFAELYSRTRAPEYLAGAESAMGYISREIIPARKWMDFEAFFSCSRKPVGFFDSTSGQYAQNTLSMQMAAEACARLYELTGKGKYLDNGIQALDYLCLYQQVWSPQWLSRPLFGGFGVQNTDAEWSDSRQGYFAMTFMRYFELTGRREYFERSVAALRAMFSLFESPTSPRTAENYGHSGGDAPSGVTGLHWGTGSSVVSIHLIERKYGDAYVHVGRRWGAGINGCRIPSVSVRRGTIDLTLLDNVRAPRTVRLTFGAMAGNSYTLVVNGKNLGAFDRGTLLKGVNVSL